MQMHTRRRLWSAGVLALSFGCGSSGFGSFLISNSQEVELGRGVDEQISQEFALATEADPVTVWARELVAPLVAASAPFRDPAAIGGYKVSVIVDDELVNAFAAPGGYVYITTGLILTAGTCAEITGVLGHELAHVTERHGVDLIAETLLFQQGISLVTDNELAQGAAQLGWTFLRDLPNSREHESEADDIGLQISHDAGYNPYGLIDFFEKIVGDGAQAPEFLSTHPETGARIAEASARIADLYGGSVTRNQSPPSYECVGTAMNFAAIRQHVSEGVAIEPGTGAGAGGGDAAAAAPEGGS